MTRQLKTGARHIFTEKCLQGVKKYLLQLLVFIDTFLHNQRKGKCQSGFRPRLEIGLVALANGLMPNQISIPPF